jgi:hypothetical protein
MEKDDITIASQADETELATQNGHSDQRQRLAQQIGRLLADTWLERKRKLETEKTCGGDVSPKDRAN